MLGFLSVFRQWGKFNDVNGVDLATVSLPLTMKRSFIAIAVDKVNEANKDIACYGVDNNLTNISVKAIRKEVNPNTNNKYLTLYFRWVTIGTA